MKPIRILAGALAEFESPLRSYIERQSDLVLVNCVADGAQLVTEVETTAVDVIVVELLLPRLDALGVLEQLHRRRLPTSPRVLVVSPTGREALVRTLLEAGADYCLLKPVAMELLGERIRQMVGRSERRTVEVHGALAVAVARPVGSSTAEFLAELGVSSRINGHGFLVRAIDLVVENEGLLSGVTKILYPTVAREFGSTPSRVERSIRHAIAKVWGYGDHDRLRALLGSCLREKPTNSEFIALLADRIREAGSPQ